MVDVLRPTLHPVTHVHPGGTHVHTHVAPTPTDGAVRPLAHDTGDDAHGAIRAASPSGLHTHILRPATLASIPTLPDVALTRIVLSVPSATPLTCTPPASRLAHARGPPAVLV